jgi:hypothetical protein
LIVRTAFPVPPDSNVTLIGLMVRVGLEPLLGEIEIARLTVPAKPPILVNVMVLLVDDPLVTFIVAGEDMIEKSGAGGGVIVRMLVTLWLRRPLVPLIVMV